jgi:tetratricopeptide (TPR) repeat protein
MKSLFITLLESSIVFIPSDSSDPIADPLLRYFELETTPKEVEGLVRHVKACLAMGTSAKFRDSLAESGNTLYRNLVPKGIRSYLSRYEGPLLICSFNSNIPWELCHDGKEFWGLKYDIGRQTMSSVSGQDQESPPVAGRGWNLLVVGTNPGGNLPQAISEAQGVYDFLKAKSAPGARLRTKTASLGEVASGLQSTELDIFHFCGHLAVRDNEPELALEGGPGLSRNAIKRNLRGQPLVYLNCCGGEEGAQSSLAIAQAFMQARASGVVASIAPRVLDSDAPRFATSFYRHLVDGSATYGAAVRLARCEMREKCPDSPVWASYVLYGLPTIALRREPAPSRPEVVLTPLSPSGEATRGTGESKRLDANGIAAALRADLQPDRTTRPSTAWLRDCLRHPGGAEAALAAVGEVLAEGVSGVASARLQRLSGDILLAKGSTWEAIAVYERVATADDAHEAQHARFGIGLAHLNRGDPEQAGRWFAQVMENVERGLLREYGDGLLSAARGDFLGAAGNLRKVVAGWPQLAGARLRLGECYLELGRFGDCSDLLMGARDAARDTRLLELKIFQAMLRAGHLESIAQELPAPGLMTAFRDSRSTQWRQTVRAARDEALRQDQPELALRLHSMASAGEAADPATEAMEGFLLYEVARREILSEGNASRDALDRLQRAGQLAPRETAAGVLVAYLFDGFVDEADKYFRSQCEHMDRAFADMYVALTDTSTITGGASTPRSLGDLLVYRRICREFASGEREVSAANLDTFLAILTAETIGDAAEGQREWLEYSLAAMSFSLPERSFKRMTYALGGLVGDINGWRRLGLVLDTWAAGEKSTEELTQQIGRLQAVASADPIAAGLVEPVTRHLVARCLRQDRLDPEPGVHAAVRILAGLYPVQAQEHLRKRDRAAAALAGIVEGDETSAEILTGLARAGDLHAAHELAALHFGRAQAAAVSGDFDACLARLRKGVDTWLLLLGADPFWAGLEAKLGGMPYRTGMSFAAETLTRLRKEWPGILTAMVLSLAVLAEENGRADIASEARALALRLSPGRSTPKPVEPGFASHLLDAAHPFLENAFSILRLSSRTNKRETIEARTVELVNAVRTAGGGLPIRRLGIAIPSAEHKVERARRVLLSPTGRAVSELLAPEPAPLPWLGLPEEGLQRFEPGLLRGEMARILGRHPSFDVARFLGRKLPVAANPAPVAEPLRGLPLVRDAVPALVQSQLPLV